MKGNSGRKETSKLVVVFYKASSHPSHICHEIQYYKLMYYTVHHYNDYHCTYTTVLSHSPVHHLKIIHHTLNSHQPLTHSIVFDCNSFHNRRSIRFFGAVNDVSHVTVVQQKQNHDITRLRTKAVTLHKEESSQVIAQT